MESLKNYLMDKHYCLVDFPFGKDIMVFKVKGKMFATLGKSRISQELNLNLKCDPQEAIELRQIHCGISPSNHLNKTHWNKIVIDDNIGVDELFRMIDNSYRLVVDSLPKKVRSSMA